MKKVLFMIFEQPLVNILFLFFVFIPGHDFGIAVILLTVLIRIILWPLSTKQLHGQKKMTALQPELKKINEKYKGDPVKQREALTELYREKEVNPGASCLLMLIQLPILFALYYVFKDFGVAGYTNLQTSTGILRDIYPWIQNFGGVKSFIASHPSIGTEFLGLVNLAKPSIALAVIAGILQFVQAKMLMPKNQEKDASSMIQSQMSFVMPVMITLIAFKLPSVLPFYWSLTTLFAIGQQWLVMREEVGELEVEEGKITKDKNKETLRLAQGGNKSRKKKNASKHKRR